MFVRLFVRPPVQPFIQRSVHLSVLSVVQQFPSSSSTCQFVKPSVYPCVCLSNCLPIHLSVRLSSCLSGHLSICNSLDMFIHSMNVCLHVCLIAYSYFCLFLVTSSTCLFIHWFVKSLICLSDCLGFPTFVVRA